MSAGGEFSSDWVHITDQFLEYGGIRFQFTEILASAVFSTNSDWCWNRKMELEKEKYITFGNIFFSFFATTGVNLNG